MGELAHTDTEHEHGKMDISDHKATFSGFMAVTVWGSALTVMLLALIVTAFAIPGGGWFGGVLAWAVIGVIAGMVLQFGALWWAVLIASSVLMLIGGAIVGAFI